MDRAEHLQWAKGRALEYADQGDMSQTLASLGSDFQKHDDLASHPGLELGMLLAMSGHLTTPAQLREWVQGVN